MNMFSEDGDLLVTPEFLKANGFVLYSDDMEDRPAEFDVHYHEEDVIYIEKGIHRQQFCVVLQLREYTDGSPWYGYSLWVQDDIGCGFIEIPGDWCELPVKYFKMIYEGIRREKLNTIKESQVIGNNNY